MRSRTDLRDYQERAIQFVKDVPKCALWVDMGLGKTVSTLTAISEMQREYEIARSLVIAPLRVARKTWPDEIDVWEHTQGLRVAKIVGTPKQRLAAVKQEADIWVVNRENTEWLVELFAHKSGKRLQRWKWDHLVIDESSSFKNRDTNRHKAISRVIKYCHRQTQLTGTPAPNGLVDLWAQIKLLDGGQRLGSEITPFRNRWFDPPRGDHGRWVPKPHAKKEIEDLISDIVLTLRAEDYLDLPPVMNNFVTCELSNKERRIYNEMERDLLIEIEDQVITAVNAGVLWGKLLQLANGAIYDEERNWHAIHEEKLHALLEIYETAQGQPMIVYYSYRHDLKRIIQMMEKRRFRYRVLKTEQDEDDWNAGEIPMLLMHPASGGHGLNLQHGGEIIVWYGLTSNLEYYQQANARLIGGHRRTGKNVVIHHIVTEDTADEDAVAMLSSKDRGQEALLNALKHRATHHKRGIKC